MLLINTAIENATSYPATDFLNNPIRTYNSIIHLEDAKKVDPAVHIAIQASEPWAVEYRLLTSNKERWEIEMRISIYDKDGVNSDCI